MPPKRIGWLALTILVALTTSGCVDILILAEEKQRSEYEAKDTQELISILQDNNQTRFSKKPAAWALGSKFKDRAVAIPVLIETLKRNENEVTRVVAVLSLQRLADPAAVPALVELLSDGDSDVRAGAADVLGEIGPRAREAVPVLQELANKDGTWLVRLTARNALPRIAPKP